MRDKLWAIDVENGGFEYIIIYIGIYIYCELLQDKYNVDQC